MNRKKISCLSALASGALAVGALLIGSPASAGVTEPATTAEARQMAQESQARAEQYRAMGGVGYKTGLVQREEADAARYSALADQMEASAVAPATTTDEQRDAALVEHDRSMGGAAYKTGLVQSAEAQERRDEAAAQPPAPAAKPNPICLTSKPVVILDCDQSTSQK